MGAAGERENNGVIITITKYFSIYLKYILLIMITTYITYS